MNAEPMTQQPTAEQLMKMSWSCDERACPPCGPNNAPRFVVWAFGDNGDGPHLIEDCETFVAAQAIVAAHKQCR